MSAENGSWPSPTARTPVTLDMTFFPAASWAGVTPRVIRHVFAMVEAIRKRAKPGEKCEVSRRGVDVAGLTAQCMTCESPGMGDGCLLLTAMAHVLWNMHPAHLVPPKINACALELYNEDLLDLAVRGGAGNLGTASGWDIAKATSGLKLQERPIGKEGRVVPEVRLGGVLMGLKQAGNRGGM